MHDVAARLGLAAQTLEALRSVLARHARIERAVIYGSRAKGSHRIGSDIDLALFGEALQAKDMLLIEQEIDDLDLPYRTDLSLYPEIENVELRAHIDRVGQVIYPVASGAGG